MSRSGGLSAGTIAVCVIVVIANLGNTIVAPVLPAIRSDFGSSAAEVALMVSGFGLGRLAMDLPAGMLTERVSTTRLFAVGILLSGGAAALAAFSDSLQHLILFRTLMGFGSAIVTTVSLVTMVNLARPGERGKVLAVYTIANLLGAAISPTIGGYLATLFDWRAVFVFCAITPFVSFPLNLLITGRATGREEAGAGHGAAAHGRKGSRARPAGAAPVARTNVPALVAIYFSTFLLFFNRHGMQSAVLPLYGAAVLGMDPVSIGAVLSSRALFTMAISYPAGALADRISRKGVLIPAMLVVVAGNLYLVSGDSLWIFTVTALLISTGILGNNVLSVLVADLIPERLLGRGMGMYRFTSDLGTVLGPFSLGLIVDHFGFGASSLAAGSVILLGVVACLLFVPGRSTPDPTEVAAKGKML